MNDAEVREKLRPIVESYGHPQSALVPAINALLDAGEGIGAETASVLADVCGAEDGAVKELLGQYRPLSQTTQSGHLLCFGMVCRLLGAEQAYEHLRSAVAGGDAGEVVAATCLGHCYAAPVLKMSDGTLHKVILAGPGG